MRKSACFFAFAAVLLLTAPVIAGEEAGTVAKNYFVKIKPGMEKKFEEAYKTHLNLHREENDTWAWHTWVIINGDQLGTYVMRSPGHHWADFDARAEFEKADAADFEADAGQYVESMTSMFVEYLPDLSRWPEGDSPPAFAEVYRFHLNSGKHREFMYIMKKIHEAIEKENWPINYAWLALVNGGKHPTFTLVVPHNSWAEMKGPEEPLWDIMEKVYGRQEADKLRGTLGETVHCQTSFIAKFRPDLSYQPASQ
jgi:hypothetical protein